MKYGSISINIKYILICILLFSQFSPIIHASRSEFEIQTGSDPVLDSLENALNNSIPDTSKIKLLNEIAWYLAPSDMDQSIHYADSAITLSKTINWKSEIACAHNTKGEALRNKGHFKESLNEHLQAIELFKQLNDQISIAKTESDIGIAYFNLSDFSKSFKHFDNALEIFKVYDDKGGLINVYGYIGVVFSNFDQQDKAIEYFEKSLEIAIDMNQLSKMGTLYNNLGLAYVELKKYDKSINYYKKAMASFKNKDDFNYSIAVGNLGIPQTELRLYSDAIISFNESLNLAKNLGDKYGLAHQYGNLGELYFKMEKDVFKKEKNQNYINESIKYLKLSISEFKAIDAISDEKDYLIILSDVYSYSGKYKSSLESFKSAKALQDSIQSKENLKVTASLEIKQELENKKKEITILNQDREYQAMIKTAITIFAFLILFIAGLIFYFYKKKQNDNLILQNNIKLRQEVENTLRINEVELTKHKNNLEILVKDRTKKLEHEIIEHKETEEALLAAIERAEVANHSKSVFLANMSHELRTPLVGILGYSDLLTSIVEDPDSKEMAEGINRTGNRLLNTLSLILDLARIESDKFEIDISKVDVIKELKETFINFKAMAAKKNLKLILDVHDNEFILNTDLSMLKVILDNLVNNAIKFTKEGEVTILTDVDYANDGPQLIIKVIDTGVGINKNDISLIFEEFKQLSEGTTKDFQGSGLGLSITKKFTELLGGNISVDSAPRIGSTFTIKFPLKIKAVA